MLNLHRRQLFKGKQKLQQQALPWLKNVEAFFDLCERCNKCVTACEQKIIKLGDGGFPHLDFSLGECTFCRKCADVCPLPLFNPPSELPWLQRIHVSEQCLNKKNIECRSCSDACEMRVIRFQPQLGKVAQMTLDLTQCNGCGACVAPCPAKAITIRDDMRESK